MKRRIILWQLLGFAVTACGGVLLHFLYDWLGNAVWIAPFAGVNESTWEHMKLLFWPMLVFAAAESFFFRERDDFWCVKLRGILLGLVLIPVIFYTCDGIIGDSPDWLNISIFFICAALVYVYEARLLIGNRINRAFPKTAIILLGIIAVLFVAFTFTTPHIGLFEDPLTGAFGIG